MVYLILFGAILANASANILIKLGMQKGGQVDLNDLVGSVLRLATNYLFILGIICFVVTLFLYSYTLQKINLNTAYPIMTSMGLAIVITFSALYLKESLTFWQFLGILFIGGGVWLVATK